MSIYTRKALVHLELWAQNKTPKPLVLRGARQVGKSTLVELFAHHTKRTLHKINLETHRLLTQDLTQTQKLLIEVEAITQMPIQSRSIVFFDEIQKQPQVFPALRYLYEKHPGLLIIAAGSLLEFHIEDLASDIPVGRLQYYHMGPFTFFEFLKTQKQPMLYKHLAQFVTGRSNHINERYHQQALEQFSIFLRLGGMPEAIKNFGRDQKLHSCLSVHQSILQTYEEDFYKYATRSQLEKLEILFRRVPGVIGQKTKWNEIDPNAKARDLARVFDLLCKARVVHRCSHSNATGMTLESTTDHTVFKPYLIDVGLLLSCLNFSAMPFDLNVNNFSKGNIVEQFVAQMLVMARGPIYQPELYYWLRDKKINKAEVDFLIELQGDIFPIEVKNQPLGKMKSLEVYCLERNPKLAINFYFGLPQETRFGKIKVLRLPIYLAEKVFTILPKHF